jgi:cytochrome P450
LTHETATAHDAPRREVHFDHHSADFTRDPWSHYARLRSECPVGHTDSYGGFWVLSRYEDVRQASLDDETFSSELPDLLIPARSSPRSGGS